MLNSEFIGGVDFIFSKRYQVQFQRNILNTNKGNHIYFTFTFICKVISMINFQTL